MQRSALLSIGACLLALTGCGDPQPHELSARSQADFVNGGFEAGNLTPWTVSTNINRGIAVSPPLTIGDLNLRNGGNNVTSVKTGAAGSLIPSGLTAAEQLRVPRFGRNCAVINEQGANRNSNTLKQTMTTTAADVDATDGNIHVRFALAPVLQNPAHLATEQPYFYIELTNTTKGSVLFSSFNFSGQAGVPWKSNAGNTVQYTDWQLFDVAPGPTKIAIGDQLSMTVIASGCSLGAHWGQIYVDGFGTFLPGLSIVGSAPQSVNAGTNLTYTFTVKNGDSVVANSVVATDQLPAGTTFVSSAGATCTTPAVGMAGSVTCSLGALNPGAATSFTITVAVPGAAVPGSTISNGNYTVAGMGISPIIGPLVKTTVTSGAVFADLGVSVTDGNGAVSTGQTVTYTVVVSNAGPATATNAAITNNAPNQLNNVTWTCVGAGGATCGMASGTGNLNTTATLPMGGTATYTVTGTVANGANGPLNYLVNVAPPTGVVDPNLINNSAVDTNAIGNTFPLTVDKTGSTGVGTITSSPAAIQCGAGCTTRTANFLNNSTVVLTAVAAPGSVFTGWGGACAAAGAAPVCTVTADAARTATANFSSLMTYMITASAPGGNGTITCTTPVPSGQNSDCVIVPAAGYGLTSLTLDGTNVLPQASNNRYTITNVTAAHAVVAGFSMVQSFPITVNVNGGNGTVTCPSPVTQGSNVTCTVTPDPGYSVVTLNLDGMDISGTLTAGTFTINNVQGPHTVDAAFAVAFPVSATVIGGNGTIQCPVNVAKGTTATCTITPDAGYTLDTVSVNGNDGSGQVSGNSLAIPDVQGPQDITVTFKKANGTACGDATECHSGFCTTGVCCNEDCTGNACRACNLNTTMGTCSSTCGPYGCNTPVLQCFSQCSTDEQCIPGSLCVAGQCMPPGDEFALSGGGVSPGCEYGGSHDRSSSLPLAALAMMAFLAVRRRSGRRAAA